MFNEPMTPSERRAAFSLAGIFSFRMLGLFMILPVFSLYAHQLNGATATLIGLALGIYGLTQALLQIPFGMLSDKIGRKPIIITGLLLFACGSVIAATAHSITGVILGRALQGAGAVGSTIIALLADLTREEHRTKAMAIIGMVIGMSFTIAMVLGPILNGIIGVSGIFWLTAVLAILGVLIVAKVVPNPAHIIFHRDAEPEIAQFGKVLSQPELLRLDLGIFSLHAILTACFIAIPIILQNTVGLPEEKQWYLYLPVLILAFFAMVPFIIAAEKKRKMRPIFLSAITAVGLSQLGLWFFHDSLLSVALLLFIFFTAFTLLEASLPSLISKVAPSGSKGTAMGVYSSSQFLGIFVGGTLGGWCYGHHHVMSVFLLCAVIAGIWLFTASFMKRPPHLGTLLLKVGQVSEEKAQQLTAQLLQIAGVAEAAIMTDDGIAYLKVDNKIIDKKQLEIFANQQE